MRWIYVGLGVLIFYLAARAILTLSILPGQSHLPKVKSLNYDLTLHALLDRDVPEVDVAQVARHQMTYQWLDARSRDEYEVSHLAQAHWVGYDDFHEERIARLDKNQITIVYCSVGYRSEKITQKLRNLGFKEVYNLYGGVFEWINQGHDVVDMSGRMTSRVHAYNKVWGVWVNRGQKVYQK